MKKFFLPLATAVLITGCVLFSCKKEEIPVLSTLPVNEVTGTSAVSGGRVISGEPLKISERGLCWSKFENPDISEMKISVNSFSDTFEALMTDLDPATTYYVRAYATNDAGTGYGEVVSFTTAGRWPESLTQSPGGVTISSAVLNGVVLANYLPTSVYFEYGLTTSYGQDLPASPSNVSGFVLTGISADLTGLDPGMMYHYRVKAVNVLGTSYGNDVAFTTLGQIPSAETVAACCLNSAGGRLNGIVNAHYLPSVVTFEYGLTTEYGSEVTAPQSPVSGNTSVNVYASLSGLTGATTYHFRIKAVNELGTVYGQDKVFTTLN